jgi:hypothetical protein
MKYIQLFEGFLNEARTWTDEELAQEAGKYTILRDFREQSPIPYQIAHKRGIISHITAHMEREKMRWTDQELADEAAKYSI